SCPLAPRCSSNEATTYLATTHLDPVDRAGLCNCCGNGPGGNLDYQWDVSPVLNIGGTGKSLSIRTQVINRSAQFCPGAERLWLPVLSHFYCFGGIHPLELGCLFL